MPFARLVAPSIVAVYSVDNAKAVPGVSVKVAILWVESSATDPVASTQGDAHVTVKVAVPVIGATGTFSVAVICGSVVNTLMAPFSGVTAVTTGTTTAIPLAPKMGSLPQPMASAH